MSFRSAAYFLIRKVERKERKEVTGRREKVRKKGNENEREGRNRNKIIGKREGRIARRRDLSKKGVRKEGREEDRKGRRRE